MAAEVTRKMQTLRIVIAGSWVVYAAILVLSIPIPTEAVLGFVLSVIAALIGISAAIAAMVNARLWRMLALTAALVYLVGYATRVIMWIHVYGLSTVLKDSGLIAKHFYNTFGIVSVVPYTFSVFAMPALQLAIVWLVRASPNPSLQGTRHEAARPWANALEGAYGDVDVSWHRRSNSWTAVPELDRLKEQVAYLKLWLGIMVVTDISLVGWLASAADGTRPVLVALAVITVALVTTGIVMVHRHIERRIDQIGKL
jgi:hypothetical protein